jgi:hypothetical protein
MIRVAWKHGRFFTFCIVLITVAMSRTAEAAELWASSSLEKVLRDAAPPTDASAEVRIEGSRGETASGQAVFRAAEDVASATAHISDLEHRDSDRAIPSSHIQLQWVRYIDISRNSAGLPEDELVAKAPASIPDPFWEGLTIPVAAGQAQPIWIEINVPQDAPAGDYDGQLTVDTGDTNVSLPVVLHVWNFDMPAERHVSVINWGVFPGQTFGKRAAAPNADYFELYREFCAFLVAHRQTDIIGGLDMIERKSRTDGSVTFDTSRLERHAETAFDAGIRQMHLHAVGDKSASILDPAGRVVVREERLAQLQALEQTIQRRGWQGRFLVAITDEPFIHHEESFAAAVEQVHQAAPSVRVIEAVETEYLGKLDVYVPKLSHLNLWYPHFEQQRREQGGELWFYTCCHPAGRYPNRFLDQSLLKVRVLHWINYLYNLDGYLHWGLNHYGTDDPYSEEGISKDLPLGDRAVVYPGENRMIGSLRLSAQRDGLQDYEYLRLLEDRLHAVKDQVGADAFWLDPRQRSLELCRRVIWSFHDYTRDPNLLWQTRQAVAEEIESLATEPLLVVQTSPPEGTPVPAGPRMVNVRGLVPPGATVTLNGEPVPNVRPSGYFAHYWFPSDDPELTITVEHHGRQRSVCRTFPLVD